MDTRAILRVDIGCIYESIYTYMYRYIYICRDRGYIFCPTKLLMKDPCLFGLPAILIVSLVWQFDIPHGILQES